MAMADFLLVPISIIVLQIEIHSKQKLSEQLNENVDAQIRANCRLQVIMWAFFMSVSMISTVIITLDR